MFVLIKNLSNVDKKLMFPGLYSGNHHRNELQIKTQRYNQLDAKCVHVATVLQHKHNI